MKERKGSLWGMLPLAILGVVAVVGSYLTQNSTSNTSKNKDAESVVGAEGKTYDSYRSACNAGDFNAAREIIAKMKEEALTDEHHSYNYFEESINEAEEYVINEELQYLASMNDEQANRRIILILNQPTDNGFEAAEGACLGKRISGYYLKKNNTSSLSDLPSEVINFRKYIQWCGKHNTMCNTVLGIAISFGNQSLAKKILHQFRSDPELNLKNMVKDSGGWEYYDVYAHYTNGSRNAAQKKYDEAVKTGAFN